MMKTSTPKIKVRKRSNVLVAISLVLLCCFSLTTQGQIGKSMDFDGLDDRIDIPATLVNSSYTKEMWFRTDISGALQNLFSGSGTALYIQPDGVVSGGNLVGLGITPFVVTPNVWYHVAVTYDVNTNVLKLYQNGLLVHTSSDISYGFEHSLQIGAFTSSFNFNGQIDDVRLWDVVRTDAEILANYQCEIDHKSPNLIAYYTFDDGIAGGNNTGIPYLLDVRDVCHPGNGTFVNFAMNGAGSNFIAATPITGPCAAEPEIHIVGLNTICIADGDNIPSAEKGTDFGIILNDPVTHTFTIRNHGTSDLTVTSIASSSPADFVIGGATMPIVLPPNDSTTFTITFTSVAPLGTKFGTITILSDDVDEASYEFDVTGENAIRGASLAFGGASQVQTPLAFANTSYTKEMWIYPRFNDRLMNLFTGTTTALYMDDQGRLGGGNLTELLDATPLNINEWVHVALTFEVTGGGFGTSSLYKNGVLVATAAGVPVPTETALQIGAFSGAFQFIGMIDEVRFWNVARTATEIANSYNCLVNADAPGLVAYYNFNQGVAGLPNFTETTLKDITCNGNHGTLIGFGLNGVMENWVNSPSPANTSCGGAAPDINVRGLENCVLNGDVTPSVTDNTDFGLYNTPGNDHTFWIYNLGDAVLNITNVTITGVNASAFSILVAPASTVAAGDSTFITIRFASTVNGPKNATLNFFTNDANESIYSFSLVGEGMGPVPVSLISFNGMLNNKFVDLKWTTSNEINNAGFEVLRSDRYQQNWTSIGYLDATGMNIGNYMLTDYAPQQGINTYRLKQIDLDGTVAYSQIISINYNGTSLVRTFPNPFKNQFTLAFNDESLLNTSANLLSANGVRLARIKISGFTQTINMEKYTPGVYLLQLQNGEVLRIIKK